MTVTIKGWGRNLLPLTWRRTALFVGIGAMVSTSFNTAIFVFVGPIRLVSLAFDHLGWSGEFERLTVSFIVLLMILTSLAVTSVLTSIVVNTRFSHVRVGIIGLIASFALLTGTLWMYPSLMISGLPDEIVFQDNFAFGAYPDRQTIAQLDSDGYTIVSLMHPAILPYEKRLLEIERESVENVGAELIEIPMLPWMAQNSQAIGLLRDLGAHGEGKYYVHCWFGMHRTVDAATVIFEARESGDSAFGFPEGYDDRTTKFALPDLALVVLLGAPVLFFTGVLASVLGWLRCNKNMDVADTRKIFHIAIFTAAAGLQLTLGLPGVILLGMAVVSLVIYSVYRGRKFPFYEALARSGNDGQRRLMVILPMLATGFGGVASNVLFFGWAHIGYLVCGWGDAAGEIVGRRFGSHKYSFKLPFGMAVDRSLEGSIAVLVAASFAAMVGLIWGGVTPITALWVAPIVGMVAAGVEAVSGSGTDNFFIQIAAAGSAQVLVS